MPYVIAVIFLTFAVFPAFAGGSHVRGLPEIPEDEVFVVVVLGAMGLMKIRRKP